MKNLIVFALLGTIIMTGVRVYFHEEAPKDFPYVETDLGQIRPGIYKGH